ncbi:MAG: hypothetical protein ACRDHP_10915 [Ktedonobacterales bacterium]
MSSTGRSGSSDTERTNLAGEQGILAGASDPFMLEDTAPGDVIDVVEIVTVEEGADDTFDTGPTGFRWWYAPAIGLPVAVGAGAAIWYLTKGEEPYLNAWELVTRPVRTLTGQPKLTATTKKAVRRAGAANDTLRDKVSDALAGFDAAELAEKAGDLWDDARDSMTGLWDQITDRGTLDQARGTTEDARDAARRQIGKMIGNIAAAATALAIQQKTSDLADAAREKAKAARASAQGTARRVSGRNAVTPGKAALGLGLGNWLAQNRTQAKANDLKVAMTRLQRRGQWWQRRQQAQAQMNNLADTAGNLKDRARKQLAKQTTSAATKTAVKAAQVKTGRAARKARKRVLSPFRRVRAFAFAALVTAMVIYVRSWYSRRGSTAAGLDTGDMRETASGRMEPDTWPRFADLAPDAAAPTPMNAPTEPS